MMLYINVGPVRISRYVIPIRERTLRSVRTYGTIVHVYIYRERVETIYMKIENKCCIL